MLPEDEKEETGDFPGDEAIEQAFLAAAAGTLPLDQAEVFENEYGVRIYSWPSPCEMLGALTASIHQGEITLGTNTYHTHVGKYDYEVRMQSPTRDTLTDCIARAAVQQLSEMMRGGRIFSVSYNEDGSVNSSGSSPRDVWEKRLGEERGKPASQRFWDWHGEVFRD